MGQRISGCDALRHQEFCATHDHWADEASAAIVGEPACAAPLRIVVRALARTGDDAGMGLALTNEAIAFLHHWHLIGASEPAGCSNSSWRNGDNAAAGSVCRDQRRRSILLTPDP